MVQAIVFLPLLGFILAGIAALVHIRQHAKPVAAVAHGHHDHAHGADGHGDHEHGSHGHGDDGHDDHAPVDPALTRGPAVSFAQYVTTALLFVSCILSWATFLQVPFGGSEGWRVIVSSFIVSGGLDVSWALRVDAMSAVMLVVVTTVSALVHLYSIGYMSEDDSQPRFFAYLSLFTFAMLMLVTSDNLVQMFFGWEGVGLASYLLIGFWFHKKSASDAAMKAFIVNRVGDFGFALGIFLVFWVTGSTSFDAVFAEAGAKAGTQVVFFGYEVHAMTLACLLLFMGAMGKSAQFFLHTWLPDAMEGPTPVSALIHAATMVTAGVFMVARLSPLFELAPSASTVVIVIGGTTALFAATVGLVQNDIKRVIAYSTCSQLGYMFVALGVGAYSAGMFHLFTHAFFKALLFLGAGSVIHAMHHEQDMRHMGGLWKHIPFTGAMMAIGTLALTGFPFTAGYYSKDAIIEAAYAGERAGHVYAFLCVVIAAGLTSFYSWRLFFMTFLGVHRGHGHGGHAIHESPPVMTIPLAVLAVGALFAGLVFANGFIGEGYDRFWKGAIGLGADNHVLHAMHEVPAIVVLLPTIMMVIGFAMAVWFYILSPALPARLAAEHRSIYLFLLNKWYFDELYDRLFVQPSKRLGRFLWQRGDQGTIDRFGPDGAAFAVTEATGRIVKLQSGYVFHYAFAMLLGIAALVTWFLFAGAGAH